MVKSVDGFSGGRGFPRVFLRHFRFAQSLVGLCQGVVLGGANFGLIGEVAGLPSEPQVLGSGSKARVLEVKLDSGESVVIPRANVELIEA